MRKYILPIIILLSGCDGHYRYACQDPQNWNNPLCNKPKCLGEDACTDELIGDRAKESQTEEPHNVE